MTPTRTGRVPRQQSRLQLEQPAPLELRDYQLEAVSATLAAYHRGVARPLVVLPTGAGKTLCFAALLKTRGGRGIVLAHRDELVRQAVEKINWVAPDLNVGVVKAERNELWGDVLVASIQTLAQPRRLMQLTGHFDTVICDEAHHSTNPSSRTILEWLGSFEGDAPLTLGVTATPERADGVGLGQVWQEIVYSKSILEMILAGYLCDLRAVQVSLAVDFNAVKVTAGDFQDADLGRALTTANAPKHVVAAYREHAAGRKALVFTPTVEVAYDMADAFNAAGIAASAVDGETPQQERRQTLERFRQGKIKVLANCGVLTEGYDEPSIDCIIIARPTRSRVLYTQCIGRGTRIYPGKQDCLILDVVGATGEHKLVTATELFDLGGKPAGLSVREAERWVGEQAARRQPGDGGVDLAPDGTVVITPAALFGDRDLHWTQTRQGMWALSIGGGVILRLQPDGQGTWDVAQVPARGETLLLHRGLPLDYAMGVAEDVARSCGALSLLKPDAPWRGEPASSKQLGALRRWKIACPENITKGQASDLLSAIMGDRG